MRITLSRRKMLGLLPLAVAACTSKTATVVVPQPTFYPTQVPSLRPTDVNIVVGNAPPSPTNTPAPTLPPSATRVPPPTSTPIPPPLPTVAVQDALGFGYRMGVNCIDDYDSNSGSNFAAAQGAPVVVTLGTRDAAIELKRRYPNCVVVFRAVAQGVGQNPDAMLERLAPRTDDPPMFYVGHNENEGGFAPTPDGVRARAAFDIAVAEKLRARAPNATYLAASFAHGEPEFTNPDVVRAMREAYAPAYNRNLLWMDLHNYTLRRRFPHHSPQDTEIIGPQWFERRWEFLFTQCGFDPSIRHIAATESGVETGSGGFPSVGFTPEHVNEWLFEHRRIQLTPLLVNGKSYASPFRFGALYQFGNKAGWGNYDVRGYLDVLRAEWRR